MALKQSTKVRVSLDEPIASLLLSVRSSNCLRESKISTLRQLIQKTPSELLRIKNFGRTSLNEIQTTVQEMGFALGMMNPDQEIAQDLSIIHEDSKSRDVQEEYIDPDSYSYLLTPVYDKVQNIKVDELPFSVRALNCFHDAKIEFLGDLIRLAPSDVMKWRNFGKTSLRESMNVIKEYVRYFQTSDLVSGKVTCEDLMQEIEGLLGKKMYRIFCNRMPENRKYRETLEQTGKKMGITRERVRQIEKKLVKVLGKNRVRTKINNYIQSIYDFVTSKNGIADQSEVFSNCLKDPELKLRNLGALTGFNNLAGGKAIYLIEFNGKAVVSIFDEETMRRAYRELVNEIVQYYGLTFNDLSDALQLDVSYSKAVEKLCLERFVIEKGIFINEKLVGIKGEPLKNIEYLYLSLGKSVHDEEAEKAYVALYGSNLPLVSFRGVKSRVDNLLLWGRGEYIHKSLVSINLNALEKVYEKIRQAVENHEKKTSATSIFDENQELMAFLGAPTSQALYSILRIQEEDQYLYRKYPDIEHMLNAKRARVGRYHEVEKYFKSQNRDLFLDELNAYFVEKRGLKEHLLLSAIDKCSGIYKLGNNRWAHSKVLKLAPAKIQKIVQMAQGFLAGKKYALLSDLVDILKLPNINPYSWNRTLMASLLKKNSELNVISNVAIVSSECKTISAIEDLVLDIVKSSPNQFSRQTFKIYLKAKKITASPAFLGNFFTKHGFLFEKANGI